MTKATSTEYVVRGRTVSFLCPVCQHPLNAPLLDAGTLQECPKCGASLTVPGNAERLEWESQERAEQREWDRAAYEQAERWRRRLMQFWLFWRRASHGEDAICAACKQKLKPPDSMGKQVWLACGTSMLVGGIGTIYYARLHDLSTPMLAGIVAITAGTFLTVLLVQQPKREMK